MYEVLSINILAIWCFWLNLERLKLKGQIHDIRYKSADAVDALTKKFQSYIDEKIEEQDEYIEEKLEIQDDCIIEITKDFRKDHWDVDSNVWDLEPGGMA